MDYLKKHKEIVLDLFTEYAAYPYEPNGVSYQIIQDEVNHHYLLVRHGMIDYQRIYAVVYHVDLVGDKIWVQNDITEEAIANKLVDRGISKACVVIGYFSRKKRQLGEFAVD